MSRLPEFPIEAFPPKLALFCENVAHSTQTPPELAACAMLGALSAVSLGVRISCGRWQEELGLYLLVVMGPATRKSAVMRHVIAPLEQLERERRSREAERVDAMRSAKELAERRRQALLAKAAKEDDRVERIRLREELAEIDAELREIGDPQHYRLITSDTTAQALGGLLARHGKIAVLSDEGAFLDNIVNGSYSDGKANLHLTLQAWQGSPAKIDRTGRGFEEIPRPLLTIMLAIQEHYLPALIDHPVASGQGLVSRFAFVTPAPIWEQDLEALPVDQSLAQEWAKTLQTLQTYLTPNPADNADTTDKRGGTFVGSVSTSLIGDSDPSLLLQLSPEAQLEFDALQAEIAPKLPPGRELGHIADWANRHYGRVARIAGLLHLAAGKKTTAKVSAKSMHDAKLIGEFLMAHGRAALEGPNADHRRAVQVLQGWESDVISQRQLHRAVLNGRGNAAGAASIAAHLVEAGHLEPIQAAPTGGRPASPTYKIITTGRNQQ